MVDIVETEKRLLHRFFCDMETKFYFHKSILFQIENTALHQLRQCSSWVVLLKLAE